MYLAAKILIAWLSIDLILLALWTAAVYIGQAVMRRREYREAA